MFFDSYPTKWKELFSYELIEKRGFINLQYISAVAGINYSDSTTQKEVVEKTLAHLLPLLVEGKLKVGGIDILHPDRKGICQFRELTGTASEIISTIKKEWDEAVKRSTDKNNPALLSGFEINAIWFTLPETKWQYYDGSGGPYDWVKK